MNGEKEVERMRVAGVAEVGQVMSLLIFNQKSVGERKRNSIFLLTLKTELSCIIPHILHSSMSSSQVGGRPIPSMSLASLELSKMID